MSVWLLVLSLAAASSVPVELASVADVMRKVNTLSATVVQEKEIAVLAEVQRSTGTFAFARPRRLAMDFAGPGGTRLVLDGDRLSIAYKGLKKVETTSLSHDPRSRAVAEHLFLLLSADPRELAKVYALQVLGTAPLQVRMTPLAPALAKVLASVEATFDARSLVSTLLVREVSGDSTRWTFTEQRINEPLAESMFTTP